MKLITLLLEHGPAAAELVSEGKAKVFGSVHAPSYADVGAVIEQGLLDDAAALSALGGEEIAFTDSELLAPILEPGAVFCVGLNYGTHIREMGREIPPAPTIFDKLPRALTSPNAELRIPLAAQERLDYEGEFVIVIGKAGRDVAPEDALSLVAGYTLMNDISMRDYQQRSMQWFAGKSWQELTPWGPALVTSDEYTDLSGKDLLVTVNGGTRQTAQIDDLVYGVAELISDLSTIVELRPGDIIATGTPGGVAEAMDPKGYLVDGDIVEVSITGLGTLRNTIRFNGAS